MVSTPAAVDNSARQYLPNSDSKNASPNQQILPLTAIANDRDHLEIGGCDVVDLVQKFGSPLYILDETSLRTACRQYRQAFDRYYPGEALVLYASKAWNCLAVCAIAHSEGLGVDVVSGGELYTALTAGVKSEKLYLHGNNKSRSELEMAIEAKVTVVVDNWLDLHNLVEMASVDAPTRILLRLTPGIECHTHEYIRTGHLDSKFGFDPDQMEAVFQFLTDKPQIHCAGLDAHIGSQIFDLQAHQDLTKVMVQWFTKAQQYNLPVSEIDVGGGLGIRYTESDDPPSIDEWVRVVCEGVVKACEDLKMPLPKLIVEPGRSLIGSSCITAYTVGSQKTVPGIRTYITVDGGMSDNPRPITYQSVYRSLKANQMSAPCTETVTVAGKHCESGDILIKQALLPPMQTGDILVVASTGAYNYSMASNYNRLPRPAAVLVQNREASLILQRESIEDLLRHDRLPERLVTH
ncbi:diaminopimelate decarboxylase [Microcoleus sp. FACHB-1515]|uniref:diaminopimelate decarboxylase n=1 Tax=Cyanophyceae TaxID=3028117 RepID=UPI001681D643|nr:diaminopimelate decarboxylase [Microcoleus sp. FACHB-1515]MBD2091871.1 diaminopimelate decarboxylase [Microcoleus sp. FACHB-1515]